MSGAIAVGYFLFSTAFSFILFILWARFALSFFRVSSFFSFSQTVFRLTNPILLPIHLVISRLIRNRSRYDWSCLVGIFILELVKYALMGMLFMHTTLPGTLIIMLSCISMIVDPCDFLFYAIIIRAILSWVSTTPQHPIIELIYVTTEPLLYRIRKMLPATGGLDFSPLVALVLLKMISLFLTTSFPLTT